MDYQGLSLDVALHFGTLIAVVAYFYRDWIEIFKTGLFGGKGKYSRNFLWFLFAASIPGALAGFFFEDLAEGFLRNPLIVAFALVFFGFWLYYFDKTGSKKRSEKQISLKDAIYIGIAQAIALIPGTSRSGITITAGLKMGLSRKSAARFSFLMATPIIFGANLFKLNDLLNTEVGLPEIFGIILSAVSGYLAIAGLIKLVEKVSYKWFFYYRLILSGIIILFWIYK